jgi:integrase
MAQLIQFPSRQEQKAIATWVSEFERDYFTRRARTSKSETTWEIDYRNVFNKLPIQSALTADILLKTVTATQPETRTRKRYCIALNALAKFAGLPLDLKPYSGSYSPKKATPRDLPDDSTIVLWHDQITAEDWRWAYGMLATYGLRPHELFHLDYQSLTNGSSMLRVVDGKTGARTVFPLYPEWVTRFNLLDIRLPKCTGRANKDLGNRVTHAFNRLQVPFPAYALRHCWAIRSLEFGWEVATAAQQMGHSVAVHTTTYHAWINERHQQKMFDALMQRSDRPRPPIKMESKGIPEV